MHSNENTAVPTNKSQLPPWSWTSGPLPSRARPAIAPNVIMARATRTATFAIAFVHLKYSSRRIQDVGKENSTCIAMIDSTVGTDPPRNTSKPSKNPCRFLPMYNISAQVKPSWDVTIEMSTASRPNLPMLSSARSPYAPAPTVCRHCTSNTMQKTSVAQTPSSTNAAGRMPALLKLFGMMIKVPPMVDFNNNKAVTRLEDPRWGPVSAVRCASGSRSRAAFRGQDVLLPAEPCLT
mmetsp:Transcript_34071/g.102894  ORF Transcript_34071/g.102894 Transcript_34071/m.102894 type:complete len:236 (-) Transcript_34071:177-884(-)